VTHHGQRGEGELAATLDRLADAVDRDQLLDHAVIDFFAFAVALAPAGFTLFCHCLVSSDLGKSCGFAAYRCGLERWTAFAGRSRGASGTTRAGGSGTESDMAAAMPLSSIRTAGHPRGQRRPAP